VSEGPANGEQPATEERPSTSDLERELHEVHQLLLEERRRREQLEQELEAQRRDLTRVEIEQEDLREAAEILGPPEPHSWRDDKRGLGAGLTVTGIVCVVLGLAMHFAARTQFIETDVHLGYFFGVAGILMFLLGFMLVW
jgi:hypothetical protein